jgi:hypothetical protein
MSAAEVIEQIQKLPRQEQEKVADYLQRLQKESKPHKTEGEVSEEFKRVADEVFTKNAELFRKLAQ